MHIVLTLSGTFTIDKYMGPYASTSVGDICVGVDHILISMGFIVEFVEDLIGVDP